MSTTTPPTRAALIAAAEITDALLSGGRQTPQYVARIIDAYAAEHDRHLREAVIGCLPDLRHYAATHGPGPDRRLADLVAALACPERSRRELAEGADTPAPAPQPSDTERRLREALIVAMRMLEAARRDTGSWNPECPRIQKLRAALADTAHDGAPA